MSTLAWSRLATAMQRLQLWPRSTGIAATIAWMDSKAVSSGTDYYRCQQEPLNALLAAVAVRSGRATCQTHEE